MTIGYFRLLLIASLVVGVIGGWIDFAFPALRPEAFQQAQELHDSTLSTPRLLFLGGLGLVLIVLLLGSVFGLYMLRPWAPRLSLVGTLLALVLVLVAGTYAQSGLAIAMSYLASYLWGAVLVIALCPPFNAHFKHRNG